MHPLHKDWIKVPQLLEELRGLFDELSDEELDNLKRSVVEEGRRYLETKKSCSDRATSNANHSTGTNVRG
jgi:predicted AAA+ superfamily ATPase